MTDALVVEVDIGGTGAGAVDWMMDRFRARFEVEVEVEVGSDVLRSDVGGRGCVVDVVTGVSDWAAADGTTVAAMLDIDDGEGSVCEFFACREERDEDEDGGEGSFERTNCPVLLFLFFKSSLIAFLSSSEQFVKSAVASSEMFCTIL